MCELIDPHDNKITVCVLKGTVGNQPNVRVVAMDYSNAQVAKALRMIADDLDRGVPKAQMDAQKN